MKNSVLFAEDKGKAGAHDFSCDQAASGAEDGVLNPNPIPSENGIKQNSCPFPDFELTKPEIELIGESCESCSG